LFKLIASPQLVQIIRVTPSALFLLVLYILQAYALLLANAGAFGQQPTGKYGEDRPYKTILGTIRDSGLEQSASEALPPAAA